MQQLVRAMKQQNLEIQIYLGNEVFVTKYVLDFIKNDKILSINNSKYMLVEFPRSD